MFGFGTLDFNDSLTRGGLLPAPGGDESPRASITKTIQLLEEVAVKMQGRSTLSNKQIPALPMGIACRTAGFPPQGT